MEQNTSFTTRFSSYRVETTLDGHTTLWSEAFGESCHSQDGALAETTYHYLEGTGLIGLDASKPLNILEVGLGTGLGLKLTLDWAQKINRVTSWQYTTLEIDPELAQWALKQAGIMTKPQEIQKHEDGELMCWNIGPLKLNVLVGDARKTLSAFRHELAPFDAIYQDAFSPKKNPALWTLEWFYLLKEMSKTGAWMSTYSASTRPRVAMARAGWQVFNVKGYGHKRDATRASLGTANRLPPNMTAATNITDHLLKSQTQALSDKDLVI